MFISKDIKYIGVNDRDIDLFEGQYIVPNGMAYNSYVILDEKIAVMDTVDKNFGDEWLENLETALEGRTPNYLIVQHMEPDHSANIMRFAEKYKDALIVASLKAFTMMNNFFGTDFQDRRIVVKEGDTLALGAHILSIITAPMVHWPEVIMTYDSKDKVLFSADGFGKFGATDADEVWACEARRYYIGIVGKYGAQVQAVLKKAAALTIETICPLHGPVLSETKKLGYVRARVNGEVRELSEDIVLDKNKMHTIEIVIDRLIIRPDIRTRLADSVETALNLAGGDLEILLPAEEDKILSFSLNFACEEHGISFGE
ncbi:MAG: MBL fold metallo-hydrolase, partial [Clostridia bacterium]|nr:MBL fold metallo-hydrolase [Clostridia bacterium]